MTSRLAKLPALLVCLILLLEPTASSAVGEEASSKDLVCPVGKSAPAFTGWMWQPNSRVKVFTLADHFKAEDVAILRQSLESWSALAGVTGSSVSFSYEGQVTDVRNCDSCLTLMRGQISRPNHAAQLEAMGVVNSYIIRHAKILVDFKIKDSKELANTFAHEIGHTFGLLDCFTCQDKTTVMNAVNGFRGRMTPSECDLVQVTQAYQRLAQHTRSLQRQAKLLIDEGEEPLEDDTPIINREPR